MALYYQSEITPKLIEIFNKNVDKITPFGPDYSQNLYPEVKNNCWKWIGSKFPNNPRGILTYYLNGKKQIFIAYRISYIIYNGDIAPGE